MTWTTIDRSTPETLAATLPTTGWVSWYRSEDDRGLSEHDNIWWRDNGVAWMPIPQYDPSLPDRSVYWIVDNICREWDEVFVEHKALKRAAELSSKYTTCAPYRVVELRPVRWVEGGEG